MRAAIANPTDEAHASQAKTHVPTTEAEWSPNGRTRPVRNSLQSKRRLCAILAADVVGYSRLMDVDEDGTHERLMSLRREVLDPGVARAGGRIVKNTGDGFLAAFDGCEQAARCALDLQAEVAARNADQQPDGRIAFRMAINVADVIIEPDDIYGGGVNVAARLQAYAEPGGLVVSGAVIEQLPSEMGLGAVELGALHLRNLARPVHVYALRTQTPPERLVGDAAANSEPRPSIAVLPFRKHQSDPEEGYFADGIVDVVIHALAGLKELFVISRGSTLGYGGATLDMRAIGRELGVRYVLYGSVLRSGGRVRISTELSDTETGNVVRSDQYDGDMSDLFALQDQIAINVVKTIAPNVRERELRRAMRKHPQNMSAYDFVLQAIDLLYRMDDVSFARARGFLQQAIAHDPGYAPAYSYIAYWYVFRVGELGSTDPVGDAEAGALHAAAAIERDPNDSLALAVYGHVHSFLKRDFATAEEFLERALAAGPNSAMAWTMSSATKGFLGDGAEAVRRAEQGVRLSPLDAHTFWHEGILAQAHYVAGDLDQALAWARSAVGRNPAIRFTSRVLIATLAGLGRREEATNAAKALLQLHHDFGLHAYARRCPFQPPVFERWIGDLRRAGLPE
jgi:adenylate cyclase